MSTAKRATMYTPVVDVVVYDTPMTRVFVARDWIDLAIAAADQAGASRKVQEEMRSLLMEDVYK